MKVDRILLGVGFALFLGGLLAGLATPVVANPRAGLAAHMQGLTNGMFLLVVALAWAHLTLGRRLASLTRWLLIVGTWINFIGTLLSAVLGTSRMTPIAGAGFTGAPWAETLVDMMLIATVPTMVPALVILLWGVVRAER